MLGLALLMLLGAEAAEPCPPVLPESRTAQSQRFGIAFRSEPAQPQVGAPFALEIAVCAKDGAALPDALKVDAHMPAHRHGMNYAPTLRPLAPGRYRAEGMLFHMPGRWELLFDLTAGGTRERLAVAQEIE